MTNSYCFMANTDCEHYKTCHANLTEKNCLFCYCPLYPVKDCGGRFQMLPDGWKDCTDCEFPHKRENYDKVVEKLIASYRQVSK